MVLFSRSNHLARSEDASFAWLIVLFQKLSSWLVWWCVGSRLVAGPRVSRLSTIFVKHILRLPNLCVHLEEVGHELLRPLKVTANH
jgi:hypothetical protein